MKNCYFNRVQTLMYPKIKVNLYQSIINKYFMSGYNRVHFRVLSILYCLGYKGTTAYIYAVMYPTHTAIKKLIKFDLIYV